MGRERKGTAAKSVDSDIHTKQDKTSILHNVSDKDSKIMEQMTSLKKSKPDETQTQGKKITHTTHRHSTKIKFKQFPLNVAHARTVHKLQGKSIKHLVISTWDYTDNWIYVVLSRCKTLKGLFIREPLNHLKTRGMSEECLKFHREFRSKIPRFKEWY